LYGFNKQADPDLGLRIDVENPWLHLFRPAVACSAITEINYASIIINIKAFK